MKLTIAYMTCRVDPKLEWFLDSLAYQIKPADEVEILVVSFHELPPYPKWQHLPPIRMVKPKPCVWQGEHRLTMDNWFAASNARNTALCCAQGEWLAYVDDLSVLCPSWFQRVRLAMNSTSATLGSYRKVRNLVVENGTIKSFDPALNEDGTDRGMDSRWSSGGMEPVPAAGSWLFGCSMIAPLENYLRTGGWPEFVDGMGSEDTLMGIAMQNAGVQFMYDRQMMTYESEELHHVNGGWTTMGNGTRALITNSFRRIDKGVSPNDKSHAALKLVVDGNMSYFPNYYEGGIAALRKVIQAGGEFPICKIPAHDWFDGQPISQMT